ncbi:MAG: hypothetical protein R6U96_10900 [Promethearchaeia archaeon]
MDLEKDYQELYDHWHQEYLNTEITPLNQNKYSHYQGLKQKLEEYTLDSSSKVEKEIYQSYKNNISFLFEDLLKIREIKIINTALSLEEINLSRLTEQERLLYKNLIRSIKGFKKLKAMEEIGMETSTGLRDYDMEVKPKEKENKEKPQDSAIEEDSSKEKEATEAKEKISGEPHPKISAKKEVTSQLKKEKMDYMVVRFLKDCPAIIGADLIKYAPFKEEDLASLPEINAKILITEQVAEEIKIEK